MDIACTASVQALLFCTVSLGVLFVSLSRCLVAKRNNDACFLTILMAAAVKTRRGYVVSLPNVRLI